MAEQNGTTRGAAILLAVGLPVIIGALALGIAAFSGGGGFASGRTRPQVADPADTRIAKTIEILNSRIDTCEAIKSNEAAIDETISNLNNFAQDLAAKKDANGNKKFSDDQIKAVATIASDAIADLNSLKDIASKCGEKDTDTKAAAAWNSFVSRFEGLRSGEVLGIPIDAAIVPVDQNFSDDGDQTTFSGKVPRIYQWDYGDVAYPSASNSSGTIKSRGCGVIAMAMAIQGFGGNTDAHTLVRALADLSIREGSAKGLGTANSFFFSAAQKYSLQAKQIFPRGGSANTYWDRIVTALKSGQLVVVSGQGPRPFSSNGHYIVLTGIDEQGNITLNDGHHSQAKESYNTDEVKPYVHNGIAIYK